MVCRRWWRVWAAIVLLRGLPAALALAGAPVPSAPTTPPTAKDFEAAAAKDLPTRRAELLKAAPANRRDRETWSSAVCADFSKPALGVNSTRPEVRLNSAMLMAQLGTLSSDRPLMDLLKNPDQAVRYWAARGLVDISGSLIAAGGDARVRVALADAAKVEKSGVVHVELIKALVAYDNGGKAFAPLLDALEAISDQMATSIPEVATLQTATLGLDAITKYVATAADADKVRAAKVAARIASFAAQQQKKNEAVLATGGLTLPADYIKATQNVVNSATKVGSAASGTTLTTPPTRPGTDELLMHVNVTFGTGTTAGDLQKAMKTVPIPPTISGP